MDPGHNCGPFLGGPGNAIRIPRKRKARRSWLDRPSLLFAFGLEDNFADPLAYEQSIVVIQTRRFALDSGFLLQLEGVEVFGSILNVSFQLCPRHRYSENRTSLEM